VGVPLAPATVTVTFRLCEVVILGEAGVTVTVGVARGAVTVTADVEEPEAPLNVPELAASGV
jgi:hypothetical protein